MTTFFKNILTRFSSRATDVPVEPQTTESAVECVFARDDAPDLPVYRRYRYSIKPGWKYFGPLSALDDLNQRGMLRPADQEFLQRTAGERTLMVPIQEARHILKRYIEQHPDQFLSPTIPDLGKRLLTPLEGELEQELASTLKKNRSVFERLEQLGIAPSTERPRVLEIGYTSGGISLIAFEAMGCEVHGIDNFFDDSVQNTSRHEHVRSHFNSSVTYHRGDITQQTDFDSDTFDVIYSVSTIEHISDLRAAFREFHRILKPGGVTVHHYDPYYHPAGGHSLGILDSPWGHVRLSSPQLRAYLQQLRPHEAAIALPWIENALRPESTIAAVQRQLVQSGLGIRFWEHQSISDEWCDGLHDEVIRDAVRHQPDVTLADLLTRKIRFVAQKTGNEAG